jgi:hypothetical protein
VLDDEGFRYHIEMMIDFCLNTLQDQLFLGLFLGTTLKSLAHTFDYILIVILMQLSGHTQLKVRL